MDVWQDYADLQHLTAMIRTIRGEDSAKAPVCRELLAKLAAAERMLRTEWRGAQRRPIVGQARRAILRSVDAIARAVGGHR